MALVPKDGLIQVRLPKADADRFREWAEKRSRSTASAVLRSWVYEALDNELDAPQRPSLPVSDDSNMKQVAAPRRSAPKLGRAERRRAEQAMKKATKRGA